MEREKLKSRLGFILLSAGCAIGIGNVWKFPYMAGQGGGGAFVLFYLIFLIILGLPIMTMEFAVGRASRKSPVRAYQALEKPGQKWHIHGYLTLIGCYLLMMFYTTVAGWMLHYFYMTATGKLAGLNADQVAGKFTEMLADPGVMTFWMVFVVALGIFVCAKGLQNGLERVTKVMMIALLVIMVVLAVNSLFMPGAKKGLSFFLVPDFGRMKEVGVVNTLVSAFEPGTDTELPIGQRGELCISGPGVMKGYYNKPAETAAILRTHADGRVWVHTGDIGYLDEDGFVYLDSRIKRLIIRHDGFKVFPSMIENVISRHPAVHQCSVVGCTDKDHVQGRLPFVYVVLDPEADKKKRQIVRELRQLCKEELPEYVQPVGYKFISEMPFTPVGKVDYRKLEEEITPRDY
mgnify:FL=1